jgi:hypothetical protein
MGQATRGLTAGDGVVRADRGRPGRGDVESEVLQITDTGIHAVVAAGAELGIDNTFRSVAEVIKAASNWDSLAEYLCCDKNNAPRSAEFIKVYEGGTAVVFRRHRVKGYTSTPRPPR